MSRVSYVMMNPGGERQLTEAVRTAVDDLVGELVAEAGRRPGRCARRGGGRQPDHAPPAARHRPHAARRRPVRPGHRPARRRPSRRHRGGLPAGAPPRAALHRRARRRRRRGGHPGRGPAPRRRRSSCWSTWAPTPRSCWGSGSGCWPPPARPARRSRARRSPAASGPPRGDRAGAHRPRHAGTAHQGGRRRPVVGRARLRGAPPAGRRHRGVRIRDHRGGRRAVPGRRPRRRRDHRRRAGGPHARGWSPTAACSRTSCTMAARTGRSCASPRATCGPSSWPRPRSRPASGS